MTSEKVSFKKQDVIEFLEDRISSDLASEEEMDMYEQYKWTGRFEKGTYDYKQIIHKMIKEYNGL